MVVIGLIRHGSTKWNKEGRIQGGIDIPLDEEGIYMAERLANRFVHEEWNFIYTSPLQRAKKTAKIIAAQNSQLNIKVDDRLREIGEGEKAGTTEAERIHRWGEEWESYILHGEVAELVEERIMSFIEKLQIHHLNQKVLVVSHGSLIERIVRVLCSGEKRQSPIDNASLTILSVENRPQCLLYNCTRHLVEK